MEKIITVFLLSCIITGKNTQEIRSIGAFRNNEFVWATGIPRLEFASSFNCSGLSFCQINWWLWETTQIATSRYSTICDPIQSYVQLTCDFTEDILSTNITILDQFNVASNISLQFTVSGKSSLTTTEILSIQNCTSGSRGIESGTVSDSASCSYLCNTTVLCPTGSDGSATCQFNAMWNETEKCVEEPITTPLPAPTVTVATVTTSAGTAVTSSKTEPMVRKFEEEKHITGGVLLGFSLVELIAFIILIVFLGFIDFIEENTSKFTAGTVLIVINIVCGIVLIALATDKSWSGGDIAAAVVGYIGLAAIILFEVYLGLLLKNKDYAEGHEE